MAKFWTDNLPDILPSLPSLRRLALGDLVYRASLDRLDALAEAIGKAGRGPRQYGKGIELLDVLDLAPLAMLARGAPPSSHTESTSHTAALVKRTEFCFDLIGKCENLKRISCAGLVLVPNGAMEQRFRRVLELQRKCGPSFKQNIDWDSLAFDIEESLMDFDLGDGKPMKGKPEVTTPPKTGKKMKIRREAKDTDDLGLRDLFFGTACELSAGFLWDLPELAPGLKELHLDAWSILYPSSAGNKPPEMKDCGFNVGKYQAATLKYSFLKDKTLDVGLLLDRLSSLHLTGLTIGWGLSDVWGSQGGWKGNCDKVLKLFPYLRDFEVRADFIGVGFWEDIVSRTYDDKDGTKKLTHPLSYLGIHILPPHNPPPAQTVDVFVYLSVPEIIENAVAIAGSFGTGFGWDAAQKLGTGWFELLGRTSTLVEKVKQRGPSL
ncbi:hypothetical protein BT69DRAFT_872342 [Atractiella rhizophila]|nr:hypothetical protein BT69DRAFT_872342 [Atractiella rhizophila]